MRRLIFLLLLLWLPLLPSAIHAQDDEAPPALYVDGVVVVANEEVVTLGEVNQELLRYSRMFGGVEDDDRLMRRAIDSLVDRRLLSQYAEKEDVEIDEASLDQMIAERVEEYGGESALIRAVFPLQVATREGLNIEDVKREFRVQQRIREVVRRKTATGIFVTPKMMFDYYEAHKNEWAMPERVRFREIEIIYLPGTSEYRPKNYREFDGAKAAEKFSEELLAQISDGEKDFEDVATHISMGPWHEGGGLRTRSDGGTWHTRDDLKDYMVEFLFDEETESGQISGVIEGEEREDGEISYYILKLEERHPAQTLSFEDAQREISARITAEERIRRQGALLLELRREAFIYPEKYRKYDE